MDPALLESSLDFIAPESMRNAPDRKLLKWMRAGNTAAFEEIFVRYETRIIAYAARYVGSDDLARDVCQEVFLRLIEKTPRVLICNSLGSWLFRVARNLAIDKRRRRKFEIHEEEADIGEPAAEGNPLKSLTNKNNAEVVRDLIAGLPKDFRDVVELRAYGNVPFKEIAQILHIPQGTALWRMHRALELLREAWRRHEQHV